MNRGNYGTRCKQSNAAVVSMVALAFLLGSKKRDKRAGIACKLSDQWVAIYGCAIADRNQRSIHQLVPRPVN